LVSSSGSFDDTIGDAGRRRASAGQVSSWPAENGSTGGEISLGLEDKVDRLLESHRTMVATLADDVKDFKSPRLVSKKEQPETRSMRPSEQEMFERHVSPLRKARRERAVAAGALRPREGVPSLDPPLVTRAGVLYVPPVFEAAMGLDEESAHRLIRAGFRSVGAMLAASDEKIMEVTGRSLQQVRRAKRDLDLMRLPHMDDLSADLLRLVGVDTVSRLAIMDPGLLSRDVARVHERHRFLKIPVALRDEHAIRRLIEAAKVRSE
jgi:hypothetical protein